MDWDLTPFFPSFGSPEFQSFWERLKTDLKGLVLEENKSDPGSGMDRSGWIEHLLAFEDAGVRLSHLSSYLGCLTSADSSNEEYASAEAAIAAMSASRTKAYNGLLEGIGGFGDDDIVRIKQDPRLAGAEYAIDRLHRDARHRMDPNEEALAADLGVDGFDAWGRLYDNLAGNLEFEMIDPDGTKRTVPMSQCRSMLGDPDRAIRKAAFEGSNAAWKGVARVAAAAINSLAGTRQTLRARRQQDHFLDPALFDARMARPCLEALLEALRMKREDAWQMLRFRAGQLGRDQIAWYDLEAPLLSADGDESAIPWPDACVWTQSAFDRAYPALGQFFRSACDKRWIDWSPRRGKRPGGFCTSSPLIGESRIFMTYKETVNDVMTLAHEAGHAFHSALLADQRGLAQGYPMPLAETASTFAEQLLIDGILNDPQASPARKKRLLDTKIQHAVTFLLNIPIRFEFESRFHEERASGEVPVSRLNELMVATQQEWLGDLLEPGGEDPWFWASKLHFYITDLSFYNFPYTFGFLLSQKLYSRFRTEGTAFLGHYEAFLAKSGVTDADTLIREVLGEDPHTPAFWVSAIETLAEPFAALQKM